MQSKPAQLWPDSATILERFRSVCFAQWEELLRLRRAVLKTSDLDDIHDLRVASRRFRAALELMYPIAPKGSKAELRKSVRKLIRILGGLRNIDEAQTFFQSRVQTEITADSTLSQVTVARLGGILRLADGLDRRRGGLIKDVSCQFGGTTIKINLTATEDISVEIFGANAKKDMFEKAFDSMVVFVTS